MSSLPKRVEKAFNAYLGAHLNVAPLGRKFREGLVSDYLELDCIICHCLGGPEEPLDSANFKMELSIEVRTKANRGDPGNPTEDRGEVHDAAVEAVEFALTAGDLAEQVSALESEFYIYPPVSGWRSGISDTVNNTLRTTSLLTVYCCGRDL